MSGYRNASVLVSALLSLSLSLSLYLSLSFVTAAPVVGIVVSRGCKHFCTSLACCFNLMYAVRAASMRVCFLLGPRSAGM